MAAKVKLSNKAFRELRTSPAVRAEIMRRAEAVAAAAGDGFQAVESAPRNRARAAVVPVTVEAARKNARENTLLHALDAGRS